MRRVLIGLLFALGLSAPAWAQGNAPYNGVAFTLNNMGEVIPAAGAQIDVCAASDTALPCTNHVTVYPTAQGVNQSSLTPITQPFFSDLYGNFSFWITGCGPYVYTVTGSATVLPKSYQFSPCGNMNCPPGVICVDGVTYPKTSTGIGNAITAAGANGTVYLPPGTYAVTGTISISATVHLYGAGDRLTILQTNSASADILDLNAGADGSTVDHIGFDSSVTRTGGTAINAASSYSHIDHVRFTNQFNNVAFTGASVGNKLDHFEWRNSAGSGLVLNSTGNDFFLSTGIADNSVVPSGFGINWQSGNALWITDVDILHFTEGLNISPAMGVTVQYLFCKGCVFDSAGDNNITLQGSGAINHLDFVDSWAGGATNSGFFLNNGATDGVSWTGGFLRGNGVWGFNINNTGTKNIRVENATITHNSTTSSGTNGGIGILGGVNSFQIIGNRIGPVGGEPNTQGFGITIASGSSNNYIIKDNDLTGNLTGGLSDAGTGSKEISGNLPNAYTISGGTNNLPSATNYTGQSFYVTDEVSGFTEGATCSHSGAGPVTALAFSNGSVWKCF